MMASPMRARGPWVQLESVEWLPEVSTRETPEDVLIAREGANEKDDEAMAEEDNAALREIAADKLKEYLERIPSREALALMLHLGLLGYPATLQTEIAEVLDVRSQQVVSYAIRRARERILYLATRPPIDLAALARVLSPTQLEVVRLVYETASFREAWRQKKPDAPTDRGRSWERTQDRRIKRAFIFALAKIERRPDLAEQAKALRHVLAHLRALSHHAGKGSWRR